MSRLSSLRELLRHAFAIAPGRRRTKNARNPFRRCLQLEALEDRLVPAGDILVTGSLPNVGNVFQEYTSTGSLIRTVPIPPVPNDSYGSVASIAQDANGNVYVWDGRSTLALAVYNAQSGNWSQLTYPQGWSTGYQSGQTGVAVYGDYAYVSNETGPSGQPTEGVIRFDLDTGIGTDFNPFGSGTVSVAMGLDGNLYALGYNTVYELDPNTMALENTINLPSESYIGLAVDAAGDIYLASSDGTIDSFDPTGTLIATTTLAGNPASIAIASDGTLAVGTQYNGVVQMTTAFTNVTTFNVADGGGDIGFAQVAPPGPASPAESIISLSESTVQSGTMTATVTLTTKDARGFRETSGGLDVQFGTGNDGAARAAFSLTTDNGDGTYTATFTGTTPGANVITATINGKAVSSDLPILTVTPANPSQNVLVTKQESTGPVFEEVNQAGKVLLTVPIPPVPGEKPTGAGSIAGDANGNVYVYDGVLTHDIAVYNLATHRWSQLNYGGWASHEDYGLALDGQYAYTGSSTGQSGNATEGIIRFDLTTGYPTSFNSYGVDLADANIGLDGYLYALYFNGDTVYKIDPITMDLVSSVNLPDRTYEGIAVNATGDIFAVENNGTVDHFNSAGQLLGSIALSNGVRSGSSIAIGPDGTLAVGFSSGAIVRMTSAFTNVTNLASGGAVSFVPPPPPGPASLSRSVVSALSRVPLGGTETVTLDARDVRNDAETTGGLTVAFGLGAGPAIGTFGPVTDNGDGTYSATFTAGTLAATNTITATINGLLVTSTAPMLTVEPGPASPAQSTVSVSSAVIKAGSTAVVTVTAVDAYGNAETSGGLSVGLALGNGAGSGMLGPVIDHGNGTYTAVLTGTIIGSNTIIPTINSQALTSPAPTFTVSPGPVSLALSTVALAPATIAAGDTTTVTLTALDAGGNPYPTAAKVTFAFTHGSTAGGTFSNVTNAGNGVYTAVLTGINAGPGGVTASINGLALTSVAPVLTVTPLAADHFKIVVGKNTATVTAQDVYNNAAPSFSGSVSAEGVNSASTPLSYMFSPASDAGLHKFSLATAGGVIITNLTTLPATPANVAVQADLNLAAGQYAGLVTNDSGPTDNYMYYGAIVPNPNGPGFVAAIWVSNSAGSKRLTAYTPIASGAGTLEFETVGSSLQLFWRAVGAGSFKMVAAANDSSLTGGTVGVRMGPGVTLNNVRSTEVTA
jgi:adhesin/invasin